MHSSTHRLRRGRLRPDRLLLVLLLGIASLIYTRCMGDASEVEKAPAGVSFSKDDLGPQGKRIDVPKSGKPVRFMMYNVRNYFVSGDRRRSPHAASMKPEDSREAVADAIASVRPDVVGLLEVGGKAALQDLSQRLAKRGVSYPYGKVLERDGEDRALAVLSVYPFSSDDSKAHYPLYGDHRRQMLRGILDVTVDAGDGRLFRILGVHLKSRVADDQAAAASLRRREAETVALHVARVMRSRPGLPVVLFGDFNDGPSDSSVRTLGTGNAPAYAMERLNPKDSRGEAWTIYYKPEHTYQTFDHIFVNKVLKDRMEGKLRSGVGDMSAVRRASDHRPVWAEFR